MKKVVAMMLSLVLALGLMVGCGQKDAGTAGGTKTIESLKIAFSPYADADQITTATEPLEALLKAKLLEKGYDVQNIDMTVGTSYTAVGEALSAGSADIGFISGGNYVLFSDACDGAALRHQQGFRERRRLERRHARGEHAGYDHLLPLDYSGRSERQGSGAAGKGQ